MKVFVFATKSIEFQQFATRRLNSNQFKLCKFCMLTHEVCVVFY
jgi:hypothetical protein